MDVGKIVRESVGEFMEQWIRTAKVSEILERPKGTLASNEDIDEAERILNAGVDPSWDEGKKGRFLMDVSGKHQVYFTLWRHNPSSRLFPMTYLKNLSTDIIKAAQAAKRIAGEIPVRIDRYGTMVGGAQIKHKITFGKYRGLSFEDVYVDDPRYLIWLSKNADMSKFSPTTRQIIQDFSDMCWNDIKKKNIETSTSSHQGSIGDKFDGKLNIYAIDQKPEYKVYKMSDDKGNKYLAYNLDKLYPEARKGDSIDVSGKIGGHKDFLGVKFTHLNYIKRKM